jgi:hypothetical protein
MINLPRGETVILRAEGKDYERGLLVRLLDDGGYKVAYWYNKPDGPAPVEVLVDDKSIKKDAKIVELKFHPDDYNPEAGLIEQINKQFLSDETKTTENTNEL